jgi:predicted nucleic acid-binding protein
VISAVDTNILLDILIPQAPHADASEHGLSQSASLGALIISDPVYAELAAHFPSRDRLDHFLADTGIRLDRSQTQALYEGGRAWRQYRNRRPRALLCPQCGKSQRSRCMQCGAGISPRQHVLADFIIGAHALVQADRLLTRDRGYYGRYFPRLKLADRV